MHTFASARSRGAIVFGALFFTLAAASPDSSSEPALVRFTGDHRMEFPADYREWVFLSAGKGMTYGPAADPNGQPLFDNVFVNPAAYRDFLKTGHWPDKTVFVLEVRAAATEGSINKGGQFQKDLRAIEVEMKDNQKFSDTNGWAFFGFGNAREPAAQIPKTEECYACHAKNGAVENTFVQFYPTLIGIAREHGTVKVEGRH